jgi:hypothetical protein
MEGWECHSTQQLSCHTLTHDMASVVALRDCRATAPAQTPPSGLYLSLVPPNNQQCPDLEHVSSARG